MKQLTTAGTAVYMAVGSIGGAIAFLIGGWEKGIQTLLIFMLIDYLTGLALAVLNKSSKTATGGLSSKAGLNGLFKKAGMLVIVIIAQRLDVLSGTTFIKDACIIVLIANEGLSIIENLGTMGVPIPKVLINVIEALKKTDDQYKTEEPISDEENNNEESEEVDS